MAATHPDVEGESAGPGGGLADSAELHELQALGLELKSDMAADGYAVCRTNRFASDDADGIDVRFGLADPDMRAALSTIHNDVLLHMETSLLPFRWTGEWHAADSDHPFLVHLGTPGGILPGVGFPVRLGIMGNGYVALFGRNLDLAGDRILEIHRRAYRLMRELLQLDVRNTAPRKSLNDRELQCLQLAADGYKSDAIAEELGLSVHTVNAYLGSAADKLDAVNRIQAIAKAIRLGFIG